MQSHPEGKSQETDEFFAVKDGGHYLARTVAKGYSQVLGKDFQETTFHLILALKAIMGLKAGQFDIETTFLYGDLEEELWMVLPDGYDMYYHEKHGKYLDGIWFSTSCKAMVEKVQRCYERYWILTK